MNRRPLRVAIIGMGGYARHHHFSLKKLEQAGELRLVATCDPALPKFTTDAQNWDLEGRGVTLYTDYLTMLDAHRDELDFVTVPTPIPLHAPMHRACIERGLGCYLEKPPTLSWMELDSMLAVEEKAKYATQVGFNFIAEAPRRALKRRLLAGEFGRLELVGFLGHWPRAADYFTRNAWAGRLMINGQLVLDSCTGNAMAHYIHNLLFWCGEGDELSWGEIETLHAELYRAHDIESFDTCFAEGTCTNGVEFQVAASHAVQGETWQREWLKCEQAIIHYDTRDGYIIRWHDGREEKGAADSNDLLVENLHHYAASITGEESRPLTRLVDSRPFVHFNNLLFLAAKEITTFSPDTIIHTPTPSGSEWLSTKPLEDSMVHFLKSSEITGDCGIIWGRLHGEATIADLPQLQTVVTRMQTVFSESRNAAGKQEG